MGMRVHLQGTADFTSLASSATDVREFMMEKSGVRPRQVVADQAEAARQVP
jgi:hypothetical protein